MNAHWQTPGEPAHACPEPGPWHEWPEHDIGDPIGGILTLENGAQLRCGGRPEAMVAELSRNGQWLRFRLSKQRRDTCEVLTPYGPVVVDWAAVLQVDDIRLLLDCFLAGKPFPDAYTLEPQAGDGLWG